MNKKIFGLRYIIVALLCVYIIVAVEECVRYGINEVGERLGEKHVYVSPISFKEFYAKIYESYKPIEEGGYNATKEFLTTTPVNLYDMSGNDVIGLFRADTGKKCWKKGEITYCIGSYIIKPNHDFLNKTLEKYPHTGTYDFYFNAGDKILDGCDYYLLFLKNANVPPDSLLDEKIMRFYLYPDEFFRDFHVFLVPVIMSVKGKDGKEKDTLMQIIIFETPTVAKIIFPARYNESEEKFDYSNLESVSVAYSGYGRFAIVGLSKNPEKKNCVGVFRWFYYPARIINTERVKDIQNVSPKDIDSKTNKTIERLKEIKDVRYDVYKFTVYQQGYVNAKCTKIFTVKVKNKL